MGCRSRIRWEVLALYVKRLVKIIRRMDMGDDKSLGAARALKSDQYNYPAQNSMSRII